MILSLLKKIINNKQKYQLTDIYIDNNLRVAESSSGSLALYAEGSDDKPGQRLTDFIYKSIYPLKNNVIMVEGLNGKFGFINRFGEELWPCEFDSATDFNSCLSVVSKNGKFGVIHTTGRYILAPIFRQIIMLNGSILADNGSLKENNHNWFAYTLTGEELVEHDNVEFALPPLKPKQIIKLGLQGDFTNEQICEGYSYLTEQVHSSTFALMVYKVAEQEKKAKLKSAKPNLSYEDYEELRIEQEQKLVSLLHELFDYKRELN